MAGKVAVVRTGIANTASVIAAFERLGAHPFLTVDPLDVQRADHVVVPGVGAFGAAMTALRDSGLVESITQRLRAGRPTFAICLGLQVLCERSEESPGVEGLGLIPASVGKFPDSVRVPQLGWNRVDPAPGCALLQPGWAYFANSFRLAEVPDGWHGALSEYGGSFVAALERGNVLACQFHPELSGRWGLELIGRWLATADQGGA